MSEQEEKLQVARRLINEKRYDDARALLRTMPDSLTAQKWLQKLEGTASQTSRRTSIEGSHLMLAAVFVMLVLTFAVAVYGAFLKPVPTLADEEIVNLINGKLGWVSAHNQK
ncbi:MAG: hypothetical protein M5R40_10520 [Anaerolineae bacterium]|nr:hypothetical protein [Anaerolineae bacterium]